MDLIQKKEKLTIIFSNETLDKKNIDFLVTSIKQVSDNKNINHEVNACIFNFDGLIDIDTTAICYLADLVGYKNIQFFIICNNEKINGKINITGLKSLIPVFENMEKLNTFIKNQKFEF